MKELHIAEILQGLKDLGIGTSRSVRGTDAVDYLNTLRLRLKRHRRLSQSVARMWINQPSSQQPLHHLHGTNVLAVQENSTTYRVYFLSGSVISQQVSYSALSPGRRNE